MTEEKTTKKAPEQQVDVLRERLIYTNDRLAVMTAYAIYNRSIVEWTLKNVEKTKSLEDFMDEYRNFLGAAPITLIEVMREVDIKADAALERIEKEYADARDDLQTDALIEESVRMVEETPIPAEELNGILGRIEEESKLIQERIKNKKGAPIKSDAKKEVAHASKNKSNKA